MTFKLSLEERDARARESSLEKWFPVVRDLGITVPKTRIVPYSHANTTGELLVALLEEAVKELGGFPVFIRTDQSSGKHDWVDCCVARNPDDLLEKVKNTVADSENKMLAVRSIVLRHYYPPAPDHFTAFFGMPVRRERRYFVRDGVVECHHAYWPEDSIVSYRSELPADYKERLAVLNRSTSSELAKLVPIARNVSKHLPGYWSVDFMFDHLMNEWVLIDMARGEISYHDPHCPSNLHYQ